MLPDLTEDEKCDKFMRGIASEDIRAILRNISGEKRSLELYFSTSLSYESARAPQYHALARHLASQSHIHSASASSAFEINDPMEINLINQFRRNNKRGGSSFSSAAGNGKITCFYCGTPGHIKRNCNKLRREVEKAILARDRQGSNFGNGGKGTSSARRRGQVNVMDSTAGEGNTDDSIIDSNSDSVSSNKVMNNSSRYSNVSSSANDNSCRSSDINKCPDIINTSSNDDSRDDNIISAPSKNDIIDSPVVTTTTSVVAYNPNLHNVPVELRPIIFQDKKKLVCNRMNAAACADDLKHFKTMEFNSFGINTDLPLYR
ncbi:hypothetical protein ABG067_008124, partial [Albugo candida]